MQIGMLARSFDVTWQAAANRAVDLGLVTPQDLANIRALAREEHVARVLSEP